MKLLLLFLLGLLWMALPSEGATLLPNGRQVFVDQNGAPLAGGTVTFYIPNTTTPKQTWQDPGQTILNANPLVLDSYGSGVIYGSGSYREIVQDSQGNVIWDQLTADTSTGAQSWAATSTGSANSQVIVASAFSYTDGQIIWFRAGFTNTGALTINPNGQGIVAVYKDTVTGPQQLSGGEVTVSNAIGLVYDATLGAFHLVTFPVANAISNLTAAGTTDLGTAPGTTVYVNGSATISSFGTSASTSNPLYNLYFGSSVTINLSSTLSAPVSGSTLNLPAGSYALAQYGGSSAGWRIWTFTLGDGSAAIPRGAIMAFNLGACPTGWSQADGSHASPDLRGYFVRGLDTGGSVDPGRSLASSQGDQVQDHTHSTSAGSFFLSGSSVSLQAGTLFNAQTSGATGGMATGNSGSETRPKNVALLYCEKN